MALCSQDMITSQMREIDHPGLAAAVRPQSEEAQNGCPARFGFSDGTMMLLRALRCAKQCMVVPTHGGAEVAPPVPLVLRRLRYFESPKRAVRKGGAETCAVVLKEGSVGQIPPVFHCSGFPCDPESERSNERDLILGAASHTVRTAQHDWWAVGVVRRPLSRPGDQRVSSEARGRFGLFRTGLRGRCVKPYLNSSKNDSG